MIKTAMIKTGFSKIFPYIGKILLSFFLLTAVLLDAQVYDKENLISNTNGAKIYHNSKLIISESSTVKKIQVYVCKNTTIYGWNEVEVEIVRIRSTEILKKEKKVDVAKRSPSQTKHTEVTVAKTLNKTAEILVFRAKNHWTVYGGSKYYSNAISSHTHRFDKRVITNETQSPYSADFWLLFKKEAAGVYYGLFTNWQGFGNIYKTRPPPILFGIHKTLQPNIYHSTNFNKTLIFI